MKRTALRLLSLSIISGAMAFAQPGWGATVWTGPTITYTQPGNDPTNPTNQDRLTDSVWFTRGVGQGLFNAALEDSYTHSVSPTNTEWAYGQLSDYASLTYAPWEVWNGANPPSMVGRDAVVHLISEDIYLSIHFTSWGHFGGGFAYIRSTPPPKLVIGRTAGADVNLVFTNMAGLTINVLGTTNVATPWTNWTTLGQMTESPAGVYQFVDPAAKTNAFIKYYVLRMP